MALAIALVAGCLQQEPGVECELASPTGDAPAWEDGDSWTYLVRLHSEAGNLSSIVTQTVAQACVTAELGLLDVHLEGERYSFVAPGGESGQDLFARGRLAWHGSTGSRLEPCGGPSACARNASFVAALTSRDTSLGFPIVPGAAWNTTGTHANGAWAVLPAGRVHAGGTWYHASHVQGLVTNQDVTTRHDYWYAAAVENWVLVTWTGADGSPLLSQELLWHSKASPSTKA